MAKVNREFTPAVVKEVSPAQEVFHLELSPEEMAFIFLLVGNVRGGATNMHSLYLQFKQALGFEQYEQNTVELSRKGDRIFVLNEDIQRLLLKRQK